MKKNIFALSGLMMILSFASQSQTLQHDMSTHQQAHQCHKETMKHCEESNAGKNKVKDFENDKNPPLYLNPRVTNK